MRAVFALSDLQRDGALLTVALGVTALATPVAMRVALRVGLVDRPAPHKFHREPTPYLGGLAIALSVLASLAFAMVAEPRVRSELMAVAFGATALAAIGLVDDWATISPFPRLAVQAVAAVALWHAGIRVTPSGVQALDLPATILVVMAVTNAVNLLDNMDGLSTGTVAIASLFLFVAAYWQGQTLVAVMAIVLAGACLGFLPFNFNPARIFLGDAGTLFLGFLLATIVIKLDLSGYPLMTRAVVPMLFVGMPLFDVTLVVFSRWRAGRPVFQGGTDHSSHRLVALGASPRLAALASYAAAAVAGAGGLWLIRVHSLALTWAVAAAGVVVAVLLLAFMETVDATGRRASFVPSSVLVSALSALEVPPMLEPVPTPIRSQAGPA